MVRSDLHGIGFPSVCGIERLLFGLLSVYHDLLALDVTKSEKSSVHITTKKPSASDWASGGMGTGGVDPLGLRTTDCPGFACATFRWASRRAERRSTRLAPAASDPHR